MTSRPGPGPLPVRCVSHPAQRAHGLAEGDHRLTLKHPCCLPAERVVTIPRDGSKLIAPLQLAPGACRVTSTPSQATVAIGPRQLGRTPLLLPPGACPPGEYELRVGKLGYRPVTEKVVISADAATDRRVKLAHATGSVKIVSTPARAQVYVDGHSYGPGKRQAETTSQSAPRILRGIPVGKHSVQLHYGGEHNNRQTFTVSAGKQTELKPLLWFPDRELFLQDNRKVAVMVLRTLDNGNIVTAVSQQEIKTFTPDQIKYNNPIADDDAARLVGTRRRRRKMREAQKRRRQPDEPAP